MTRLRWQRPQNPARAFRDSVVMYAVLASLVVVVAAVTGGNLLVAVPVAVGFFLASTAYSWWRLRDRAGPDDVP